MINTAPLNPPMSPTQDEFQKALAKEECLANFAAMNKIREGVLLAMGRDIDNGGDGSRFLKVLEVFQGQVELTQTMMDKFK